MKFFLRFVVVFGLQAPFLLQAGPLDIVVRSNKKPASDSSGNAGNASGDGAGPAKVKTDSELQNALEEEELHKLNQEKIQSLLPAVQPATRIQNMSNIVIQSSFLS